MNGALGEGVLPGLLRELYVGRKSGMLTLLRGDERRGVRLRRGHIVHADTNVKDDRMGDMLVRQGKLSAGDLKRALGFALRDRKKLGQVLIEQGLMPADKLEDALAEHVHEILSKVFTWKDGTYHFAEEDETAPVASDVTLKVSTGELILEAARSVTDPDVVRYYLGDIDRVLGLASDPLLRFQRVALSAADGYVLSRVDGTLSAREIVSMSGLARDETHRALYALLSTGMIEYLPLPPKTRPGAAKAGPRSSGLQAVPEPPLPPPPPAPSAAEMEAQAAARAAERRQDDPRRMENLEAFATLKSKTHFEVLGLTPKATENDVKEAYFRLARRFHPDVHHDPALADLREKIEAIFVRLGESYDVLRNPRLRTKYEAHIAPPPAVSAPAPAPPVKAAVASPSPAPAPVAAAAAGHDPYEAARQIKRGAKLLSSEMYWDAIQVLEPALLHAEGKALQEGRVLLARAYMKNVNWRRQGEELLQQVVKDNASHVEAHVLLGRLYKEQGLKARATHMLRRAVELAPDHEEAQADLALLTASTEPDEPPAKGGIIKRLFNRS